CSSVNLARFICPSFRRPDSNFNWRKSAGAGQGHSTFVRACDESRGGEYPRRPNFEPVRRGGPGVSVPLQPRRRLGPLTSVEGPQCRQPSLSTSTRKPSGMRGTSPSPAALQAGQGAPAPPQVQARGPSQGRSGWFSQTQPRSSRAFHRASSRRRDGPGSERGDQGDRPGPLRQLWSGSLRGLK
ncbi:hypothetical protein ABIB81_009627, partial [Bradyrhizobium sp. I1.7.5]